MKRIVNRRQFIGAGAMLTAGLALPKELLAAKKKSLLVFTKSSGWEHDVVKQIDGRPSIVDDAVTKLGQQHGFDVTSSKGRAHLRFQGFSTSTRRCCFLPPAT